MYGGFYYGGNDYGGDGSATRINIVRRAVNAIIMTTKNVRTILTTIITRTPFI